MDLTKVFNNLAPNVAWTINDNNYDTITWDEKKDLNLHMKNV